MILRFLPPLAWLAAGWTVVKALNFPLFDKDLWWHLAVGREMLRGGGFPRSDFLTHTLSGTPWINFEWLGQIFFYLLHAAWGLDGIYWGKITLSLVVLGLFLRLAGRLGARGPVLLAAGWSAFLLMRPRLYERIELASFLLMPVFLDFLLQARGGAPASRRRLPWVLGALMVLWTNLHGGFVYGLAVLGAFLVGARWAGEDAGYVRALDRSFVFCLAAALVTPFGPHLGVMFVDAFFHLQAGPPLIGEWVAPTVKSAPLFWGFFVAVGGLLVRDLLAGARSAWFWAPAFVGFAVVGAGSFRGTALLAFAVAPYLAERWKDLRLSPKKAVAAWLACLFPLALFAKDLRRPFPREKLVGGQFPVGACRFIEGNVVQGKMYNTYGSGGYVEWALGPGRQAFMDGRYLFYPFLLEEARLFRHAPASDRYGLWASYLDGHGVDYAIVTYQEMEDRVIDVPGRAEKMKVSKWGRFFSRDRWALVYWDDAAVVLLKRVPKFAGLIQRFEYRTLWPDQEDSLAELVRGGALSRRDVLEELERHGQETGWTVRGDFLRKRLDEG